MWIQRGTFYNKNNNGTELNVNINIQMHYKYSGENTLKIEKKAEYFYKIEISNHFKKIN